LPVPVSISTVKSPDASEPRAPGHAELDGVQVRQQLVVEQGQPVADAEVVFSKDNAALPTGGVPSDGELRAGRSPARGTSGADRFDGLPA
jgi:hypothetical protein